jgi:hypothetical protein
MSSTTLCCVDGDDDYSYWLFVTEIGAIGIHCFQSLFLALNTLLLFWISHFFAN